jgi:hypothetical protein
LDLETLGFGSDIASMGFFSAPEMLVTTNKLVITKANNIMKKKKKRQKQEF